MAWYGNDFKATVTDLYNVPVMQAYVYSDRLGLYAVYPEP